jgi:hypothetical protein
MEFGRELEVLGIGKWRLGIRRRINFYCFEFSVFKIYFSYADLQVILCVLSALVLKCI